VLNQMRVIERSAPGSWACTQVEMNHRQLLLLLSRGPSAHGLRSMGRLSENSCPAFHPVTIFRAVCTSSCTAW
jgi:hypothetical protein